LFTKSLEKEESYDHTRSVKIVSGDFASEWSGQWVIWAVVI